MSFSFFIARRYLFSPRKVGFIHLISAISAGGVAVSCLALVVTLSVFNGFRELIGGLFTAMDPELLVVPTGEKFVQENDPILVAISKHPGVESATFCLSSEALILPKGKPLVFTLKGVGDNYAQTTGIDSILLGENTDKLILTRAGINYGTPGIGLAAAMGSIDYGAPYVYAPRRGERINMANPAESFTFDKICSSGNAFQVKQRKYDENIMIVPLKFAQDLYEQYDKVTSLELKLKGKNVQSVQSELQQMCADRFRVLNRTEQQEETFRIMNIEKFVAYAFLAFIVLIATFNIIGAVSMLIIDKRADAATLRNMGARMSQIRQIFFYEGMLICLTGAVIGVVLGAVVCLLQEHFGLLKLGGEQGSFIIDAYPVSVQFLDILLILVTAVATGVISVWYPIRFLTKEKE
ncbi:MAG: ABC transporter permease [Bacteroidaceae bacterium]|nr:ABC transporter permease [Bacteroidaceae bacterium]